VSAYQRRKGAAGEREAVALLRRLWPGLEWERRAPMQAGQVTHGHGDVDAGGSPVHIEVKRGRATPASALRQAIQAAAPGRIPVALTRQDKDEWIVTMRATDAVAAIKALDFLMRKMPVTLDGGKEPA